MELIAIIIVIAILIFFGVGNTNFFLGRLTGENKKDDAEIAHYYGISKGMWDTALGSDNKKKFRSSYQTREADDSAVAAYFGMEIAVWGILDSNTQAERRREYRKSFIEINGVKWATCNIGNSGEFAANPEDYGGLYSWEEAKRACPKGWRLPTEEEFRSLKNASSVWTVRNGVEGRLFGTAPNQIFLPAAGARVPGGTLYTLGCWGYYWSSTQGTDSAAAWHLRAGSGGTSVHATIDRHVRLSVRCVVD